MAPTAMAIITMTKMAFFTLELEASPFFLRRNERCGLRFRLSCPMLSARHGMVTVTVISSVSASVQMRARVLSSY